LLVNNIYKFYAWLDRIDEGNIPVKFLSLFGLLIPTVLFIALGGPKLMLVGVGLITITGSIVTGMVFFNEGKIKFIKSCEYKLPEIGEVIVIKKKFYWDSHFDHPSDPNRRKSFQKRLKISMFSDPIFSIHPGGEWKVDNIIDINDNWLICLTETSPPIFHGVKQYSLASGYNSSSYNPLIINIRYFESKNYWQTKADARNIKLKEIGI
jgi:hypothetical protein